MVGSGRACQRPRTSSGAPAFRAKGLWRETQLFFKFLAIIKHWCCAGRSEFGRRAGRSVAETEERGAAKPRGRGRGRRNINWWRVLIELLFLKLLFSFFGFLLQFFFKTRVALPEATPSPFGTATLRLAPPPSLRSGSARRPNALRAAQHLRSHSYHCSIQLLASDNLTSQSGILLQIENNIKNIFFTF